MHSAIFYLTLFYCISLKYTLKLISPSTNRSHFASDRYLVSSQKAKYSGGGGRIWKEQRQVCVACSGCSKF